MRHNLSSSSSVGNLGTPQGGVVSPLLANLFLHYTFDLWMHRNYPSVRFERYAADAIVHCRSQEEARSVLRTSSGRTAHSSSSIPAPPGWSGGQGPPVAGCSLAPAPLEERRDALSQLVAGIDGILFSDALGSRWSARVRQGLRAGAGGDRIEARRQPILERQQPAMAEVEEPGLCARMTRAHVRLASSLWTSSASTASAAVEPVAIAVTGWSLGSGPTSPCPICSLRWRHASAGRTSRSPAEGIVTALRACGVLGCLVAARG